MSLDERTDLNLEGEGSSCKIGWFMSNLCSNLKWAWQAHFLSHSLQTLQKSMTFQDAHVVLI